MTRRAHLPAPPGRNRRQEARPNLRLEALEDRCLLSATAVSPYSLVPGSFDPTQILVQFSPAAAAQGAPALNAPGATLGPQLPGVQGLYDVRLNGLSVPAALALFQADSRVLSAEPDYYVQVSGTPNDPQFGNEWGLLNTGQAGGTAGVDIHATQAWDTTTGSPGVVVSLIDTGYDYNNVDLYKNVWINQAEIPDQWYTKSSAASKTYDKLVLKSQIKTATPGVITFTDLNNPVNAGLVWDNNGDGRVDASDLLRPQAQGGWDSGSTKDGDTAHPDDFFGWNFAANTNNPFDDNDHGTNVAGILAAQGNNGVGAAGVDWNVQLQDVKVFDAAGTATVSQLVLAVNYSVQHGAKISNDSWSNPFADAGLLAALTNAQKAGQIVVAAAGNDGKAAADWPAAYSTQLDNIVSVAAIDRNGNLWGSSDYGPAVTLAAPGVSITNTAPGGGFDTYTGTSQAVPFVTGTLALVWGEHPTWTYKQVIAQVTSTTTALAGLKGKTVTGGIVNAAAAVALGPNGGGIPTPTPAPTPHVLTAAFSGPDAHSLNKIIVTFDQLINPATFTASQVHVTNPSGVAVLLTGAKLAPGSDGHQFEIDFAVQTAPGNYTLAIGSGVQGTQGGALVPFSAAYAVTPAQYTFTSSVVTPIPDLGKAISTITVGQDITIGSLQVTLNISHTYDSDLIVLLRAPDGSEFILVNRRGGSGHNFVSTVLTDAASTPIRLASAPFTGSFKAESPLSFFAGIDARGVWQLIVEDVSKGDVGVINGWSLTITPRAAAPAGPVVSGDPVSGPGPTGAPPAAHTAPAAGGVSATRAAAVDAVFSSPAWQKAWGVFRGAAAPEEDGDGTLT